MSNLLSFFNTETKQPRWLIKDLLPSHSIVYFSGPRKKGFKTFAQKFITMVAASGRPYQCGAEGKVAKGTKVHTTLKGEPVLLEPLKACRVLSFQQEGTAVGNKERLGKIGLGLGEWTKDQFQFYTNSHGFEDYRLINVEDSEIIKNFTFVHRPNIKLTDPPQRAKLYQLITELKPDITVLDATTFMHNGKENDPENMLELVKTFHGMRERETTVLAVMHTSKDSQRNTELKDIDLDLRGHSSQLDAYDAHIGFRRWAPAGSGWIDVIGRYRERDEQQFRVRWEIPPMGTIEPIKLNMVRVGEE